MRLVTVENSRAMVESAGAHLSGCDVRNRPHLRAIIGAGCLAWLDYVRRPVGFRAFWSPMFIVP